MKNFLQTGDPKYLEEAIRELGMPFLCDPGIQSFFNQCRELLYYASGWNRQRMNQLEYVYSSTDLDQLQMAFGNIEYRDLHILKLRNFITEDVTKMYFPMVCEEYINAISKGLKPKQKGGRGRKAQGYLKQTSLIKQWKTFHDEGMKAFKTRYRGKDSHRITDLIQFLKSNQFNFPIEIDENILKMIDSYAKKNKPFLTLVFGYLMGLIEILEPIRQNATTEEKIARMKERKRKLAYGLKKINKIVKTRKHELDKKLNP